MQNFFIKLLEKLPNKLIGASKVKSYFLSKLAEDIFRYCSISENFKINVNLNNSSENYLWYSEFSAYLRGFALDISDKIDNHLPSNHKRLSLARIFHCSVVVVSLDRLKYSLITGDTVNSVNSSCVIFSINERLPND